MEPHPDPLLIKKRGECLSFQGGDKGEVEQR
jgi:hypothetical protein